MAPRDNLQLRFSGPGWEGVEGERPAQPGSREVSWAWPPRNLVSLPAPLGVGPPWAGNKRLPLHVSEGPRGKGMQAPRPAP